VSLREVLGNGQYGPEVLKEPSMQCETYFPEQKMYQLDKMIEAADAHNLYLKLVIQEKEVLIFKKLEDDGDRGTTDDHDGFYGAETNPREVNKTRWLQQAWWRYLQARWGYSTSIHK
jgi:hypothetical protein